MTQPALEVRELVKRYDGRAVVDGLSFAVSPGELVAVLGPNGAGKTTTIEICEGFRAADQGRVRVLGQDPIAPALRPRIGVMLQDGVGGYTAARALELLTLFGRYAAHPHDPRQLLDRIGLGAAAGTQVRRLSGGQRQRLSLAMALIGRPELVFLDEPTAGMDPHARRATWDILAELRRDGVTVVLTTHLLDEAERLADRVVVVDRGRIVATGAPAELTRAAAGQVRFSAPAGLDLPSLRAALGPDATVTEPTPGRYVVAAAVTPQLLAEITAWCARHDVLAADLAIERRSLEDVFLDLTGRTIRT
ncbi:MAG TPA: ABC transporter ATP-binding protein [Jatrophihabitantaceae bacterium]|nr:ABC transporter ATP-binding protein [Jatrophihabitantaceae bacterium]